MSTRILKNIFNMITDFFSFNVGKGSWCKVQHNSLTRTTFQAVAPSTAFLPTLFCIFFLHYSAPIWFIALFLTALYIVQTVSQYLYNFPSIFISCMLILYNKEIIELMLHHVLCSAFSKCFVCLFCWDKSQFSSSLMTTLRIC